MASRRDKRPANEISGLVGGAGGSTSRNQGLHNESQQFEAFCAGEGPSGGFDKMRDLNSLCRYETFKDYAMWLANVPKVKGGSRDGQGLAPGTVLAYLNTRMHVTCVKIKSLGLHTKGSTDNRTRAERFLSAAREDSKTFRCNGLPHE